MIITPDAPAGHVQTDSGLYVPGLKFGTKRDLNYPTLGTLQGKFGEIWLGQPFMPWQQLVADVLGEYDPVTLLPRYTMCLITVQRQAGKSHLAMAQTGERCFSKPGFHGWYTAQTGQDAAQQFLKFADDVVDGTPLDRVVKTLRGNGGQIMKFPRNSWLRPHPPTAEKLHGKQSDRNDIDEGWAFPKEHGELLIQAIGPTQLTRPGAQTFVWSAGGTAESTWLAELVARLREGATEIKIGDSKVAQRFAGFEFGIPDDADPEDLDVIAEHHPAFGHTITRESLESLRATFGSDAAGWARAAGNLWTEIIGGTIPAEQWKAVRYADPVPDAAPIGYGAARAADGSEVAIAAATITDDGTVVVEILDVLPTGHLAEDHVAGWATDGPVAIDPSGPSSGLHDKVSSKARVNLLPVTTRDYSGACGNLLDAIKPDARAFRFREHPALDGAVKVATKRNVGDGGFVWSRASTAASIAALEAATLAIWAVQHRPPDPGPVKVRFAA